MVCKHSTSQDYMHIKPLCKAPHRKNWTHLKTGHCSTPGLSTSFLPRRYAYSIKMQGCIPQKFFKKWNSHIKLWKIRWAHEITNGKNSPSSQMIYRYGFVALTHKASNAYLKDPGSTSRPRKINYFSWLYAHWKAPYCKKMKGWTTTRTTTSSIISNLNRLQLTFKLPY